MFFAAGIFRCLWLWLWVVPPLGWWWSYLPLQCCVTRHWPLQSHPTQFKHDHPFHHLHRSLLVNYQVQFNMEPYKLHRDMPQKLIIFNCLCSLEVLLGYYYNVGILGYVTIIIKVPDSTKKFLVLI